MPMNNIFDTYVPKFLINLRRDNEDVIYVSSSKFSPEGDAYELDLRAVVPNVAQTTQSLNELQPEVSDTYPYKIVVPLDRDSANILQIPSATSIPTASQHYYVPVYFERFTPITYATIDKTFREI